MDTPHEQRAVHASPLRIHKPNQGTYVRWGTAVGAFVIAAAGASFLRDWMVLIPYGDQLVVNTLVPVAVLVVVTYLIYYFVGRHVGAVNFLIQTEAEMKKVNWSSRKEVIGATKVVIVTLLALGIILFVVDLFFMFFFSSIGVLKIDLLRGFLHSMPET